MKVLNSEQFIGGWFVGDFTPSAYRTKDFEVCYKFHHKNEEWPKHLHTESIEINYLMHGSMVIQDQILTAPTVFIMDKLEVSDAEFLEDCEIIVVKVPSIPNDKRIIKE